MSRKQPVLLVLLVLLAVCSLAQAQDVDGSEQVSCRVHVVNNTASPDDNLLGHVHSSLKVLAAADIMDVSVILQVQHPDVAALEVVLTAAGSSKASSSVTLKSAAGGSAGANMIQTIFSDYAPATLPNSAADAPYSSVYRPAQPLSSLVTGDSTAAGAGGSQGVWTLTVTDTAATKRPLKLTGWELWLCGTSNGPLFASDLNTTAFDGSEVKPEVSIIKKRVAVPSKSDVATIVKSVRRVADAKQDAVSQVVDQINDFLSTRLAASFEPVQDLLDKASPAVAKVLWGEIATTIASIKGLPNLLGFKQGADGRIELPTDAESIKDFLVTLERCHKDLYWCWQETGLQGNFGQDFVSTWQSRAQPVAKTWAAAQDQWLQSIKNFEANNPELAVWGDALFYSAIGTLYRAAQLDAVATVAETWADTAIRLALYLSPLRFAVNPRAYIVQNVNLVASVLRSLFGAFKTLTALTDPNNNNDVAAITAFTQNLVAAARDATDLMTLGVRTRAQGVQSALAASAGGFASGAANMNEKVAETLGALDPRLGAIFNASTDGINNALRTVASAQQDAVQRYFRASNNRLNLGGKLDETITLAGEAVVALATNAAAAMKGAQTALDGLLPGPDLQQVLIDLRSTIEGILSDARSTFDKVVPIPEIQEMDDLLRATVQVTLDMLDKAATQVQDGPGSKAIQAQLDQLAGGLMKASSGVQAVLSAVQQGFPGPMLQSTLDGIRQQGARTVVSIERLFQGLAGQFPNLDPAKFAQQLGNTLDGFVTNTLDLTTAFENVAGMDAVRQLGLALPAAMGPVVEAVRTASKDLPALATITPGANNADRLSSLQENIGKALETFAGQISTIAGALPNQPPVQAITDRLTSRTSELGQQSNELQDAIRNLVGAPSQVLEAGLTDFNSRLSNLVDDLKGQSAQAGRLGQMLAEGPLGDIAKGLDNLMAPLTQGFEALTSQLPDLPEIRQLLNTTLTPPLLVLGQITQQAAAGAVTATANINKGALQGLSGVLEGLVALLNQGQLQVAALLSGAGQLAEQLQAIAPPAAAAEAVKVPLASLDAALSGTVQTIATGLEATLSGLAPPEQVVAGLVVPLAGALNQQMGGLLAALNGTAEGLPALLQGVTGVVSNLAATAATALGLPAPPAMTPGRRLLEIAPVADLPAGFDRSAFSAAVNKALLGAASQFANAAIVAINGRPGASLALGAVQQYISSLKDVSGKFGGLLAGLPKVKVLSVILDTVGGGKVIDSLLGLQAGLKDAAAPAEKGAIVGEIASVLGSLAAGGPVDSGSAVQAALQAAAKQVLPNAEELLNGFRSQIGAALASGN